MWLVVGCMYVILGQDVNLQKKITIGRNGRNVLVYSSIAS